MYINKTTDYKIVTVTSVQAYTYTTRESRRSKKKSEETAVLKRLKPKRGG